MSVNQKDSSGQENYFGNSSKLKFKFRNLVLLVVSLILVCFLIEASSFLLLKYSKKLQFSYPYFNRQISPYYVFGNSPGFMYNTIKADPKEPDVVIDSNGFITDKPISKKRISNSIRIFITGGSGPFGAGQSKPYERIRSFPVGLYSYKSSIAGILENNLQKEFPDKTIEVINACCYNRMLHQSIAYYLETISDFSPDIVISLDGQNDLGTMCGVSSYKIGNEIFKNYIKLNEISNSNKNISALNFVNLMNRLKIYKLFNNDKDDNVPVESNYFIFPYQKVTQADFLLRRNRYVLGSEKFLKQIRHYHAVCKEDNVKFVFCLQPMLYREKFNKALSLSEKEMRKNFYQQKSEVAEHINSLPTGLKEVIFGGSNLISKYFIDDYLSGRICQIAQDEGFSYIDMNKEIMPVSSNVDFYVDYCHLTQQANEIVAGILLKKILPVIHNHPLN